MDVCWIFSTITFIFWYICIINLLDGCRFGKCRLENVKILNDGIDWNSADNLYWKHDVQHFEALKVVLHGNAEFEAVDVILQVRLTWEHYWLAVQDACAHTHIYLILVVLGSRVYYLGNSKTLFLFVLLCRVIISLKFQMATKWK